MKKTLGIAGAIAAALLVALLGLFFGSLLWLIRSGGAASAGNEK